MRIIIIIAIIVIIGGTLVYFFMKDTESEIRNGAVVEEVNKATLTYEDISPAELDNMLSRQDDIFLLDVHIPEQEHITGTNSFIPFDELEGNVSNLPSDKNKKIIVYCRSGSMSKIASDKLIELGYSDVLNLNGGIKAWNSYSEFK